MRKKLLPVLILFICYGVFSPTRATAERIRAFVPNMPWEIGIEIENFEPWDVLQPKTILGGSTTNGLIVTIITEEEKAPITLNQILTKYWHYGRPGEQNVEYTNDNMIIVSSRDTQPLLGRAFNGYAVKDDRSFDIHVSADLSKTTKEQVVNTIRSFQIVLSPEEKAMEKLAEDLKATKVPHKREQLYSAFTEKYPKNSWAFARLAELYYGMDQHALAEKTYLRALENHKTQPMTNPLNLWLCYDGLGLIFGMSQRYESAKIYFEKGYECAKEMENDEKVAASSYNLACLYAETGDLKSCLKYLDEAVRLNPAKKISAKTDSSFARIRKQAEFNKLISK